MIPRKILCCTDFSEKSEQAVSMAADYAKAFGASLTVLHVIQSHFFGDLAIDDSVPYMVTQETVEQRTQKKLQAIAEEFRPSVPELETHFRVGKPVEEIVRFQKEEAIDLVVLGGHGYTGFDKLLL